MGLFKLFFVIGPENNAGGEAMGGGRMDTPMLTGSSASPAELAQSNPSAVATRANLRMLNLEIGRAATTAARVKASKFGVLFFCRIDAGVIIDSSFWVHLSFSNWETK
jgi:hypothetical protein